MKGKIDTLTIESRRPGWRLGTIAVLAFIGLWCTSWYRQGAGDIGSLSFLVVAGGLAVAIGMAVWLVDHVYERWRLSISPDNVSVERRSLLRSRAWTCPRDAFHVGELETVDDGEGDPGFGAHRFIRLDLSGEVVQFMQGHREKDLEGVRQKILAWIKVWQGGHITTVAADRAAPGR